MVGWYCLAAMTRAASETHRDSLIISRRPWMHHSESLSRITPACRGHSPTRVKRLLTIQSRSTQGTTVDPSLQEASLSGTRQRVTSPEGQDSRGTQCISRKRRSANLPGLEPEREKCRSNLETRSVPRTPARGQLSKLLLRSHRKSRVYHPVLSRTSRRAKTSPARSQIQLALPCKQPTAGITADCSGPRQSSQAGCHVRSTRRTQGRRVFRRNQEAAVEVNSDSNASQTTIPRMKI